MFAAIRNLFSRRNRRLIFCYTVAGRTKHADPLVIDQRVRKAAGDDWLVQMADIFALRAPLDPIIVLGMGEGEVERRRQQHEDGLSKILGWARAAFDLPPLQDDGSGVTDAEAMDVFAQYVSFVDRTAENALPL